MILTLITCILFCSGTVFTDEVPPPQNVTIKSQNLYLVLEWDPPLTSTGKDLNFTAEYKSWNSFQTVCANVLIPSCDFTNEVTPYGTYTFRVRTELNGNSSDWVEIKSDSLEKITVISAPDVKLQSRRGKMEVDIIEPVLHKSTLKDVYTNINYRIRYWTEGKTDKVEVDSDQSRVMLMKLLPETRYCMQVEIVLDYSKYSLPSNITCEMNSASDEVELWLIAVVLFVSFMVTLISVLMIFLAVWFGYKGVRFLYPQANLPEHFKQYLSERPSTSILLAMQNSAQPKELYHEFSIITAQEILLDPKQKESLNPALTSETKDVHSEQEENQAVDAVKEPLLQ
ncbi:interleukin-10 receptor subunit beta-like [Clarias gariepinus]|uniref:interleukin-10 receptor subunit beta-like n=1 Tax=Clarias gariepinus TaxID=13013 RepID=UPI00234DF2F8|nr:interleukin-10 receptor subunit beta-like [Clarias gariepinus]